MWLLWFDAAGAAVFLTGVLANGSPYPRPHWPALLTFHRKTKDDR
jgi:hypothetical protein